MDFLSLLANPVYLTTCFLRARSLRPLSVSLVGGPRPSLEQVHWKCVPNGTESSKPPSASLTPAVEFAFLVPSIKLPIPGFCLFQGKGQRPQSHLLKCESERKAEVKVSQRVDGAATASALPAGEGQGLPLYCRGHPQSCFSDHSSSPEPPMQERQVLLCHICPQREECRAEEKQQVPD